MISRRQDHHCRRWLSREKCCQVFLGQCRHHYTSGEWILHCVNSSAEFVVVCSNDTYVLVLLIAHFEKMRCKQLWMRAGTSKKPKYIPVHTVCESMKPVVPNIKTILSFHAVTSCDTVSFFAGHSKKRHGKPSWSSLHFLIALAVVN